MPLSALVFYIESKYIREVQYDTYLFGALQAILMKKPDSYYSKYPSWNDTAGNNLRKERKQTQKRNFDDIMNGILAKL